MEPETGDDVAALEREFPEWCFAVKWAAANSGPDGRLLLAWREDVAPLAAVDAAGLRRKIREAQREDDGHD